MPPGKEIESSLAESRVFPPLAEFSGRAHIQSMAEYQKLHQQALEDPQAYWGARGREELYWKEPFKTVLEWKPPHARWFIEGKTNLSYNCLARHLPDKPAKTAILWEGEPGDVRRLS